MTVLDPVINYLLICGKKRVTLQEIIAGADRPRRPVLRSMDKLTREGFLKQVDDNPIPNRRHEYGPARRNPTWKVIRDLTDRPQSRVLKTTLRTRIWKLIRAKRYFTKADLVITSGAKASTVDEYVRLLELSGYIRRSGKDGRRVTYMLIKNVVDNPPLQRRCAS